MFNLPHFQYHWTVKHCKQYTKTNNFSFYSFQIIYFPIFVYLLNNNNSLGKKQIFLTIYQYIFSCANCSFLMYFVSFFLFRILPFCHMLYQSLIAKTPLIKIIFENVITNDSVKRWNFSSFLSLFFLEELVLLFHKKLLK